MKRPSQHSPAFIVTGGARGGGSWKSWAKEGNSRVLLDTTRRKERARFPGEFARRHWVFVCDLKQGENSGKLMWTARISSETEAGSLRVGMRGKAPKVASPLKLKVKVPPCHALTEALNLTLSFVISHFPSRELSSQII